MTKFCIGHIFYYKKEIQLVSSQSICICNAHSLDIQLDHIYGHNPSDHYGHISDYGHNGHNGLSYYRRRKTSAYVDGGLAEGLVCADPRTRTPIAVRWNFRGWINKTCSLPYTPKHWFLNLNFNIFTIFLLQCLIIFYLTCSQVECWIISGGSFPLGIRTRSNELLGHQLWVRIFFTSTEPNNFPRHTFVSFWKLIFLKSNCFVRFWLYYKQQFLIFNVVAEHQSFWKPNSARDPYHW